MQMMFPTVASRSSIDSLAMDVDLSHLSEQEVQIIRGVLDKQRAVEDEAQRVVSNLSRELSGLLRDASASEQSKAACHLCRKALPDASSARACKYCTIMCCMKCADNGTAKKTQTLLNQGPFSLLASVIQDIKSLTQGSEVSWVCGICRKKQELLAKTGAWFNLKESERGQALSILEHKLRSNSDGANTSDLSKKSSIINGKRGGEGQQGVTSGLRLTPASGVSETQNLSSQPSTRKPSRSPSVSSEDDAVGVSNGQPARMAHLRPSISDESVNISPASGPTLLPKDQSMQNNTVNRTKKVTFVPQDKICQLSYMGSSTETEDEVFRHSKPRMAASTKTHTQTPERIGPAQLSPVAEPTPPRQSSLDEAFDMQQTYVNWSMAGPSGVMHGDLLFCLKPDDLKKYAGHQEALGFRLEGGVPWDGTLCTVIKSVDRGSRADLIGHLQPGDEILEWNEQSLVGCIKEEVDDIVLDDDNPDLHLIVSRDRSKRLLESSPPISRPPSNRATVPTVCVASSVDTGSASAFKAVSQLSSGNSDGLSSRQTDGESSWLSDARLQLITMSKLSASQILHSMPATEKASSAPAPPPAARSTFGKLGQVFSGKLSDAIVSDQKDSKESLGETSATQSRSSGAGGVTLAGYAEAMASAFSLDSNLLSRSAIKSANCPSEEAAFSPEPSKAGSALFALVSAVGSLPVSPFSPVTSGTVTPVNSSTMAPNRRSSLETMSRPQGPITGRLQLKMQFDQDSEGLFVTVISADGLSPRGQKTMRNPYVKIYLLPDRSLQGKRRTKTALRSLNPKWNQTFMYTLKQNKLTARVLEFTVWDYDPRADSWEAGFLGEVRVELSRAPFDNVARWYTLGLHENESPLPTPTPETNHYTAQAVASEEIKPGPEHPSYNDAEVSSDMAEAEGMPTDDRAVMPKATSNLTFSKQPSAKQFGLAVTQAQLCLSAQHDPAHPIEPVAPTSKEARSMSDPNCKVNTGILLGSDRIGGTLEPGSSAGGRSHTAMNSNKRTHHQEHGNTGSLGKNFQSPQLPIKDNRLHHHSKAGRWPHLSAPNSASNSPVMHRRYHGGSLHNETPDKAVASFSSAVSRKLQKQESFSSGNGSPSSSLVSEGSFRSVSVNSLSSTPSVCSQESFGTWIPSTLAPKEGVVSSFLEGLGPGQMVGRQFLASPNVGDIQICMAEHMTSIELDIMQARGLPLKPSAKGLPNIYVKMYAIEEGKVMMKKSTKVAKKTLDPMFEQRFLVPRSSGNLIIRFVIMADYGRLERKTVLGGCQLCVRGLDLRQPLSAWYRLFSIMSIEDTSLSTLTNVTT